MLREPKCTQCKNYTITESYYPTCKAFPQGIPKDIWGERMEHDKPYPNDNGLIFEHKENND